MAPKEKVKAAEPELVQLTKAGETVSAHPTQVALWLSQGWQVKE